MSVIQVELSDLRGYASLVDRAGQDAKQLQGDAMSQIADGDFGRILELVTGEYESLLPAFHAILGEDSTRLDQTATGLRQVARDFAETDKRVSQTFGIGKAITDDGDASGFGDVAGMSLFCPASGKELPQMKFGFPFDQACDLASMAGLPDPRDWVTRQVAGDIGKADRQAAAWDMYAEAALSVRTNLEHGQRAIKKTWLGEAAVASDAKAAKWVSAMKAQSGAMTQMGAHLRDMVDEAMNMAQLVFDTVKFFVSVISAGWTYASIPLYGQWKLVKTLKEAWHLINNARKVISVFWSFLNVMKGCIKGLVISFTIDDLPATPTAP